MYRLLSFAVTLLGFVSVDLENAFYFDPFLVASIVVLLFQCSMHPAGTCVSLFIMSFRVSSYMYYFLTSLCLKLWCVPASNFLFVICPWNHYGS
jgi:hypothetical protein